MASRRSSQWGMVIEMPFDLVAEVRGFLTAPGQIERVLEDPVDLGSERSEPRYLGREAEWIIWEVAAVCPAVCPSRL